MGDHPNSGDGAIAADADQRTDITAVTIPSRAGKMTPITRRLAEPDNPAAPRESKQCRIGLHREGIVHNLVVVGVRGKNFQQLPGFRASYLKVNLHLGAEISPANGHRGDRRKEGEYRATQDR